MPSPDRLCATPRTDMKTCRRLLQSGSRSFFAASLLLPQPTRDAAIGLYAFCRLADDAIDDSDDPGPALAQLHRRVEAIYRGEPGNWAADRALAVIVTQYGIPRALIDALLEGFAWDLSGRTYEDLGSLRAYAARVAGTIGVMMALLMNQRDRDVLARAADLGVAMQLTNIARDVGEDAANGRLYLPLDWLDAHAMDAGDFLSAPAPAPAVGDIVRRLLTEAAGLYRRADAGIALLPAACRPCVMTARLLYAEIGEQVRRNRFDAISRRAVVSPGRKWLTLTRLNHLRHVEPTALAAPPLAETAFLVDAVAESPHPVPRGREQSGRLEWTLDFFAALEQRDVGRCRAGSADFSAAPGGETAAF